MTPVDSLLGLSDRTRVILVSQAVVIMTHKLWMVLKISLTRPWVQLMLVFMALMVAPLIIAFSNSKDVRETQVSIPAMDQPTDIVDSASILTSDLLQQFADGGLGQVEALNTKSMHESLGITKAQFLEELVDDSGQKHLSGRWPILDQTPRLRYLAMQETNVLDERGWQRIGGLTELEVLSLENVGVAGSVRGAERLDSSSMRDALSRLTKLRQLNLLGTSGSDGLELPALPRLEYVVLDAGRGLSESLKTLASHSPDLQVIAIRTYSDFVLTEDMQSALRRMPRLHSIYLWLGAHANNAETRRQLEDWRLRLPGIAVYRAEYSAWKLGAAGILAGMAAFVPFILWFQHGLMMSLPSAAVIPGHTRPHLFWPVLVSVTATITLVFTTSLMEIVWPGSLAVGLLMVTISAAALPGYDLSRNRCRILSVIQLVDITFFLGLVVAAFAAPAIVYSFLLGDFPTVAYVAMAWFAFSAVWKVVRTTRLHRILAESGLPGVPGLNLAVQHLMDQPYKPASRWSPAALQLWIQQRSTDQQLARVNRSSWTDLLRSATPRQSTSIFAFVIFFVFFLTFRGLASRGQQIAWAPIVTVAAWQMLLMMIMLSTYQWVARRGSIALDFLRPVSRSQFWWSLRMAIFHDLKWVFLIAVPLQMALLYFQKGNATTVMTYGVGLVSALGLFAFLHGWVTLIVISRKLWLQATLAVVSMIPLMSLSAFALALTFKADSAPSYAPLLAVSIAVVVAVIGAGMQLIIERRLPNWELG
jgi:hypothetical protein